MIFSNPAIFILAIQKKMIQKFKIAGATRSSNAVAPSELGVSKNLAFHRLVRQGVILEAQRGYYYINESRVQHIHKRRLDIVWTVMMIFAIIALLVFFWTTV